MHCICTFTSVTSIRTITIQRILDVNFNVLCFVLGRCVEEGFCACRQCSNLPTQHYTRLSLASRSYRSLSVRTSSRPKLTFAPRPAPPPESACTAPTPCACTTRKEPRPPASSSWMSLSPRGPREHWQAGRPGASSDTNPV